MHFNSSHPVNKADVKIFSNTTLDDFFLILIVKAQFKHWAVDLLCNGK